MIELKFSLNPNARKINFEWFRFKMLTKWVGLRKSSSPRGVWEFWGQLSSLQGSYEGPQLAFRTNFEPLDDPWGDPRACFVIKLSVVGFILDESWVSNYWHFVWLRCHTTRKKTHKTHKSHTDWDPLDKYGQNWHFAARASPILYI